ncbi:MAG: DUF2142 domain-containing protein [Microthrixaceae bacterium]
MSVETPNDLSTQRYTAPNWSTTAIVGAWLFALFALWGVTSPIMSVPDEPAHTVKAASVWAGDLRGRATMIPSAVGDIPADEVEVPEAFESTHAVPGCYAAQPEVPVSCAPDMVDSSTKTTTVTTAGTYPPLFYAIVGWPSRIWANDGGAYLMRLVAAAVGAALMALAFRSVWRLLGRNGAIVAMIVMIPPTVPFLVASVNPAGLEIAAAALWWCASLALLSSWKRDRPLERSLVVEALVGFAVLVNIRGLSALFAALALFTVAAFVGWAQVREVLRDKRAWFMAAVAAVPLATGVAWVLANGQLDAVPGGKLPEGTNVVVFLMGMTDDWLRQMVAIFGWLDAGPFTAVVIAWLFALSALSVLVVLRGSRRETVVVGLSVVATVFLPVLMQLTTVERDGVAWQGRYLLPYAIGVPLLMVVAGRGGAAAGPDIADSGIASSGVPAQGFMRVWTVVVVVCSAAVLWGQYSWLHRAAVGAGGPPIPLQWSGWSPPLPAPLLLVLGAVLAVVPIWSLRGARVDSEDAPVDSAEDASDDRSDPIEI